MKLNRSAGVVVMGSLTLALLLVAGCMPNTQPSAPSCPALVRNLAHHSIADDNTKQIVLTGSEGGYGALKVTITEEFLIQDIWDKIYQSRPYKVWYASGYKELAFYAQGQPKEPCVTLLVNASDACHIKGTAERFRCPGLNALLNGLLKHE